MLTIGEVEREIDKVEEAGLSCPRCEAANLPRRKFCAKCGSPLWEPCFRCGEVFAAGENFCGACGANLAEAAAEQLERVGDDFRAANELRSACRFNEALALLGPIADNGHPRLAERAARAEQLIRQLTVERDRARLVAGEAFQLAQQRFDAFDYDGAAGVLKEVPPPLRGEAVEELLVTIASRQEQIGVLVEELREAVRQRRLLDLPPRIERLLALKPDHSFARELADQVRQRLIQTAEKELAAHQYDKAMQLLELIPPDLRDSRLQELHRQATELAFLAWDLRNAPVIDATLAAVAGRLRKLAPDDARTVKLCDEVDRRAKLAQSGPRFALIGWARPPQDAPLGTTVDGLSGLRRLGVGESAVSEMERGEFPGRFAVACGLALAGIQQAALRINLLAGEQRGVLGRVSRLMRSGNARVAWGLDLGMSALKAVKMSWDESRRHATIDAAALVEHAKPLGQAINEADEHKLVADTLKRFLECHQTKGQRVCVGLPGRLALSRQFDLPPVEAAKAPQLVQFEAQQQFPFPLEQLTWDYQFFDDAPFGDSAALAARRVSPPARPSSDLWRRALLVGAQRTTAHRFLDAFRRLGIRIEMLQTDFVAAHNFLAYEYFPTPGEESSGETCRVAAALDIGCDVTNIVASSPQSLWFHSCGVAGQSFTRALVREFKLSVAQAEQRKRFPESAERLSELYEAMTPVMDDLLKETQQSLAAYAAAHPELAIERIIGLGGGFSLHGMGRYLRSGR